MASLNRFTTQTGTLDASSGSGAPNVGPLIVPSPTGPFTTQDVSPAVSHSERHTFSEPFGVTAKFCEIPVQPLSRSLPVCAMVILSLSGPPAALSGQIAPSGGVALQTSFTLSVSFRGFVPLGAVPLSFTLPLPGLSF